MDKGDRTGSSVRLVGSSGAGVGASAMVPVGSGRERLADMEPLINLHVAKHGIASRSVDSVFWRRIEKGYFGNFTKYRLSALG